MFAYFSKPVGHPGVAACIGFSLGVLSLVLFRTLIPWWLAALPGLVLAPLAVRAPRLVLLPAFLAGLAWAGYSAAVQLERGIPRQLENREVVVSGSVVGVPRYGADRSKFDFRVDTLSFNGRSYPSPGVVRLSSYDASMHVETGQRWRFTVKLKQARGYQNPGRGFDYETYWFANRIRATGYVRWKRDHQLIADGRGQWSIARFRQGLERATGEAFAARPAHGLLSAITIGIRHNMTDEHWETLRRTGTSHLVAISGLHVGMVAAFMTWLFSRLWRLTGQVQNRISSIHAGLLAGLLIATGYALLAGFTIPTRRALVMLAVVVIASLAGKRITSLEVAALALAAVLLFDPLSPMQVGFWLSFGAVFIIMFWLGHRPLRADRSRPAAGARMLQWAMLQSAICVGMFPLLISFFGQASIISPLCNALAIPVVGMVAVPVSLAGTVAFALGFEGAALLLLEIAVFTLEWLMRALDFMSSTDWALFEIGQLSLMRTLCLYLVAAGLLIPAAAPVRAPVLLLLLPVFMADRPDAEHGAFEYVMLEVGQGLASVVRTANHVLVFDAGPRYRSGFDAGHAIVAPYLRYRGVSELDALVISHEHNDHSGGYRALRDAFPSRVVLSGRPSEVHGSSPCRRGMGWDWDGVEFRFLWPPPDTGFTGNNASCVLQVRSRFGSVLLTGDIESEVEHSLVARYGEALQSDVLQAPHQGSKTSSTASFLQAVSPQYVLYSTGYLNRFGHPHASVRQRYDEIGAVQYNTALAGAISVGFAGARTITPQRAVNARYWRHPLEMAYPRFRE